MNRRTALWLMVLCILAAAALRFPDLVDSPPGLHYDEAANGILAGDIGIRGERPIFIPSYTGKEPLFFYIAGALMRLAGESVYILRLASALLGTISVAAAYRMGKELFGSRRIALIAAALLAVSFWPILFSRIGFRAISQPLMQALTIAALYYGLRKNSRLWLVLAGILLGLSAYTYLAVRFFPIPLVLALLPFLFDRTHRRRRVKQLALFGAAGFVVLLPLALYFVSNPDAFWVRAGQVFPDQDASATLLTSYWKSLGMLFVSGDPYWRFNIPERPLFGWLLGLLVVAGWILSIVRLVRSKEAVDRSAYLLAILVPPFMLLPTALAADDIVPSNLRAIGLLPFIFLLPAITLDAGIHQLERLFQGTLRSRGDEKSTVVTGRFDGAISAGIVLLILAVGTMTVVRTYFQDWVTREDLFYDSDADLVAISDYLSEVDLENQTLYLAAQHYRHPTIAFLSNSYDQVKWLPDSGAFVQPDEGSALYIFPKSSPAPAWALPYLHSAGVTEGPEGPDGQPVFTAYHVPGPAGLDIANEVEARFGDSVSLLGYEIGGSDGGTIPLTLFWRVDREGASSLQPFIHLEDSWGYRWSQVESFAYPSEQWSEGDVVVQQVQVPINAGTPPGAYQLRIGFFNTESGEQLPSLNEQGHYAGNAYTVDGVPVSNSPYPDPLPKPPSILNVPAGTNLTLLGYERSEDTVSSGSSFWLALWWQAMGPLEPASIRLELVGADNTGPILVNGAQPVRGTYPFEKWQPPQLVIDHMTPDVAESVEPGEYTLRLRLLDEGDRTITTADLGMLTVEDAERLYKAPKSTYPMEALFGGEIALLGYDLENTGPSQRQLRLVWQALREPSADYTVFVHLLYPDGTCCLWQQDIQPQGGTYPTDGWLAGEVVVDEYEIVLPDDAAPGQYQFEIGFYLPRTGTRLLVEVPDMRPRDALYLTRPLIIE